MCRWTSPRPSTLSCVDGTAEPCHLSGYVIDHARSLGEGAFGRTLAAADATGQALAVKVMDTRKIPLVSVRRECKLLELVAGHPHVVALEAHGHDFASRTYFIFQERLSCELLTKVMEQAPLPEATVRQDVSELMSALAHCHSLGVAHCDLRLENVMLDQHGAIRLIDFGLARVREYSLFDGVGVTSRLLISTCATRPDSRPTAATHAPPHCATVRTSQSSPAVVTAGQLS